MSTWKELCFLADRRTPTPDRDRSFTITKADFDKIRAVVEAADRYADDHDGPVGYENWKALCTALDTLGVGTEGGGDGPDS